MCGVQLQLIHAHHIDCTIVSSEPLTTSMVSLEYVNDLHQWLVIKWCLPCSKLDPLFAWLDSYIGGSNERY